MSWIGLFLLVWLACMAIPVDEMTTQQKASGACSIAALLTLTCWLLAQGRW